MKLFFVCTAAFVFFAGLPGCYSIVQRDKAFSFPDVPAQAGRLLSVIKEKNDAIRSFKGIGRIRLWDAGMGRTSGRTSGRTTRAAWLGAADGRLRIEFLGLPGQSMARFVFDGSRLLFDTPSETQVFQKQSSDPDLAPVAGVSISASEVIAFLAGGIPVYAHDSVSMETSEDTGQYILIFRKRWLGVVEKVFFRESVIEKVEVFKWGSKIYQATINDIRAVDGHPVPFFLEIENPDGQGFRITVDRQWVDVDLSPAVFDIAPAE
jgi:hypothetical protein